MTADTSNKSITTLLDKMVAVDTDYRFMAMNDLINELQVDTLRLDSQSEKRVVGLILRLLRDPSGEVQSLAVRSLGPLTTKVKDQQINTIIKELVGTMDKGEEGQIRSICSIGLKTVVNALPGVNDVAIIQSAIREAVSPLIHMVISHGDDNVRVEACEVLAETISHFGNFLSAYHLDLLDCMIISLGCPQATLRKRAIQALGSLSWVITQKYFVSLVSFLLYRLQISPFSSSNTDSTVDDQLSKLLGEHTLLQRPHLLAQLKQPPSQEIVKTLLQCFNVVARQLQRIPQYITLVLQLLTSIIRNSKSNNSEQDDIDELVIQVLETLIRRCPHAVASFLPEIIPLLCERLQYDPNYDYGVGDEIEQMECDNGDIDADDEDEAEYSDDEDLSWKVRRAAARALEAVILTYSECTADFYVTIAPLLIKRFNEREESVRLAIFSCMSALLRQTRLSTISLNTSAPSGCVSTQPISRLGDNAIFVSDSTLEELKVQLQDPNSAQSRLLNILPTLYRAIEKQTSQSINVNVKSSQIANRVISGYRHSAFMLNRDLVLAVPGHLGPYVNGILNMVHVASDDPNTNHTSKMERINVLVLLLSTHPADYFMSQLDLLVQLTIQTVNDSFYRVALEGLDLLQLICTQLRCLGGEKYAHSLFVPLFNQLQAADRDFELKEKAITVSAVFIAQIGDLIKSKIDDCLDMIYKRLKNELTRLAAVRAIQIIAASSLRFDLSKFLPNSSDELATFLSKNDRTLRMTTLRCLYTVWLKYPDCIGQNCLSILLNLIPKLLITEHDLQTTQLAIHLVSLLLESGGPIADHVSRIVIQDNFLNPLINLAHSPLLRGQALEGMLRLMRAFGRLYTNKQNEQQEMIAILFLKRLLGPVGGIGLFEDSLTVSPNVASLHRDALPSLAQCIAALLAELPMNSDVKSSSDHLTSVNHVVDRLLGAVQNSSSFCSIKTYLNLLILGELGRKIDLSSRSDLWNLLLSCLSSNNNTHQDEVKPAAALTLGRLVVGQPQTLLPPLIEQISKAVSQHTSNETKSNINEAPTRVNNTDQHQLYYLIQAFKEVLINLVGQDPTNALKIHLDSMWSLLLACAGLPEEGTRNLVSECLGRLTLVSPVELVDRLRNQLNFPEALSCALMRATFVTAVKFILIVTYLDAATQTRFVGQTRTDLSDITCLISPSQNTSTTSILNSSINEVETVLRTGTPPILIDFLKCLADSELSVRRAALVVLNTVAHHRPGLVRPLLNLPIPGQSSTLIKLLYGETVIRKELIREVGMGPFKHQEDDGLDLRKCAFECMSTLLETCLDKLVIADFLNALIDGLKDHTDIKLLSYQILQRIAIIRPLEITAKMESLSELIKMILLSKPKDDWVKQEMEKMQELCRSAIGLIVNLRTIDDIDKNRHYIELLQIIEANPQLKSVYLQILSNEMPITSSNTVNSRSTVGYNTNLPNRL